MRYLLKPGMACAVWLGLQLGLFADPPAPVDYLLLKNGSVLKGRVVQEGQTYVLTKPNSVGESRYSAAMVAKLCTSAREVYDILKKNSIEEDAGDHCRLAKFCLANALIKEAKLEIDAAFQYDRRSTEAQVLLKQWTVTQHTGKAPADIPVLPTASIPPLPGGQLEDWPTLTAPAGFQDFSFRMQPLLQAGCGTGACHGVAEGKRAFVLKRGLAGVPPSVLMSTTNLERVLGLIDKQTPESSELLKRALQPHGNLKNWPVTQEQVVLLRQWVMYAVGRQELMKPNEVAGAPKSSNDFASGGTSGASNSAPAEASSKLPVIPGMSGSAIQQTGGTSESKQAGTVEQKPAGGSNSLPPIPGVSGKGQGGNNPPPPQQTPPPKMKEPERSVKDQPRDRTALLSYARLMGILPPIPSPTQPVPEQIHITNAGTYRVDTPPVPELVEEMRERMKKQEAARKNDAKDSANNTPMFLRTGTVVNQPPPR